MDDDHYVFVGDYFTVLLKGQHQLDNRIQRVKVKYMTPEEKKRWEIVEANKLKIQEEMRKKQEYIKMMQ
jgi:hypothetical protein